MTSSEIIEEQKIIKDDLIQSLTFEIQQMQNLLNLMQTDKWNEVDLQLNIKNPEEWKAIISKFKFRDCIPEKYIIAIKKLCKLAFEESIKNKQEKINEIKNFLNTNI